MPLRFLSILVIIVILFLSACKSKEDKLALDPDNIFFDYKISAEEGDDNLAILLLYKNGDEDGEAIAIEEPGKVTLDGDLLQADSTKMTGVFYETYKPIGAFAGKHTITFTSPANHAYKEDFDFKPVLLLSEIPDTIQRNDLVFEFDGLESEDYIRVVLTDTAFENEGINKVDSILNGQLIISRDRLEGLNNGPVHLEFIREFERPIKNSTEAGGRLQIIYSLKRDFILKD